MSQVVPGESQESSQMADTASPAPIVVTEDVYDIASDLLVIPDRGTPLVPNIGLIGGSHSVLVVDTGMGRNNARKVLDAALEFARGRRLYLTTTHFHPEHAFGAEVFAEASTVLMNQDQARDLTTKGQAYLSFFRDMGEAVARELTDVEFVKPDVVYRSSYDLDLGGRVVQLRATGQAHTLGDQVVTVPDVGALFTGDLVEARQFAIFPWFPPNDVDVSGVRWQQVIEHLLDQEPELVIPGHGEVGNRSLLTDVHTYLQTLREEVWTRLSGGIPEDEVVAEVERLMFAAHPEWVGREWVAHGVSCLAYEHTASN